MFLMQVWGTETYSAVLVRSEGHDVKGRESQETGNIETIMQSSKKYHM